MACLETSRVIESAEEVEASATTLEVDAVEFPSSCLRINSMSLREKPGDRSPVTAPVV